MLAAAYFQVNGSSDGWTMQSNLAGRVMLPSAKSAMVALAPHFNPLTEGTITSHSMLPVPQFHAFQNLSVYTPPACVENTAACLGAKVVILTDGDWWFNAATPALTRKAVAAADALIAARRALPFLLVAVPQALTFENGTDRHCARSAMYTPGPCPASWEASRCKDHYCWGKADLFLEYLSKQLLPWIEGRYHGAGKGQKAAIVGFSLGGLVSCYAAWARSDVFDAAGCSSPSFWYPNTSCVVDTPFPLNQSFFAAVAMKRHSSPVGSLLYISDGTAESCEMGGLTSAPGSIPLTVDAIRNAGLMETVFEQNVGYRHDPLSGWILNTLWRALEVILPYNSVYLQTSAGNDTSLVV